MKQQIFSKLRKLSPLPIAFILGVFARDAVLSGVLEAITKFLERAGIHILATTTLWLSIALLIACGHLLFCWSRLLRISGAYPEFFIQEENARIWKEVAEERKQPS